MRYIYATMIVALLTTSCQHDNREMMSQKETSESDDFDSHSCELSDSDRMDLWLYDVKIEILYVLKKNKVQYDRVQWYYLAAFFDNIVKLALRSGKHYKAPDFDGSDYREHLELCEKEIITEEDFLSFTKNIVKIFEEEESMGSFSESGKIIESYLHYLDKWLSSYEMDWRSWTGMHGVINKETIAFRDKIIKKLREL